MPGVSERGKQLTLHTNSHQAHPIKPQIAVSLGTLCIYTAPHTIVIGLDLLLVLAETMVVDM